MPRSFRGPTGILATDLDGTLIPLPNHTGNQNALKVLAEALKRAEIQLAFVTGRHVESVEEAIEEHRLPTPDWIVSDVGTEIWQLKKSSGGHVQRRKLEAYAAHLVSIVGSYPVSALRQELQAIDGLVPQRGENQGRFKLSYHAEYEEVESIARTVKSRVGRVEAPYSVVDSCNHVTGEAYIDLLPMNVSKAYALHWWMHQQGAELDQLVFAGDSGNDLAAFVAGYRSIVVANADRGVAQQAVEAHNTAGWENRLYLSNEVGTSGVLEGCRWFGLI